MSRPSAPSMPTETQVRDLFKVAEDLCPGVRIASVGPNGIVFDYPGAQADRGHSAKPFAPVRK